MSSSSHLQSAGRLVAMYSHKRKSSRDPRNTLETHSARERMRTEHEEVRDHLKLRAAEAAKGKRQPYQDSLKRYIIQDDFLKIKGIRYCPKEDLGWNTQELKTESAHIALRELN